MQGKALAIKTIDVVSKKHGGATVSINVKDFDPQVHTRTSLERVVLDPGALSEDEGDEEGAEEGDEENGEEGGSDEPPVVFGTITRRQMAVLDLETLKAMPEYPFIEEAENLQTKQQIIDAIIEVRQRASESD